MDVDKTRVCTHTRCTYATCMCVCVVFVCVCVCVCVCVVCVVCVCVCVRERERERERGEIFCEFNGRDRFFGSCNGRMLKFSEYFLLK